MPSFSASKEKIKPPKNQNSFSTLSQTTNGQSTKKTIQAEQIIQFQPQSIKQRKFYLSLPYSVQIPDVITRLTNLFSEEIIHVEEDNQGGKILLQGIKVSNKRRYFINFLDCVGLCCLRYGLNGGSLFETYNLTAISIKKEILNNRCLISIEHQKNNESDKSLFIQSVINKIQQQLKKLDLSPHYQNQGPMLTRYMSPDSIFLQQIEIKDKIFNIFVYQKDKKWQRFRRLFRKSEQNIVQKISEYRQNLKGIQIQQQGDKKAKSKQNTKNPCSLIQSIIFQSQSLYRTLLNYFEKQVQEQSQFGLFSILLTTPSQKQITLYSIQQCLSSQFMTQIIQCYIKSTELQCNLFNKNAKQINEKANNAKCFDYLQLRDKYRLEKLNNPYAPSIDALKTLPNSSCPRQYLLAVQKVFSSVKVDCLKASKGKVQLSSMDDLLPVMIFVTARSQITDFPAYVKMIDDYIKLKNVFELEQRIITTLYVAVQDITKKWNI